MSGQVGSSALRSEYEQELLYELEQEAERPDINIEHLVNLYRRHYPGEAVWRLTQDINRQALLWYNVIEAIKNADDPQLVADRYERNIQNEFKGMPSGSINLWGVDLEKGLNKLRNFGKGLVKIARSHLDDLLGDLNVQAGTVVTAQVQLGWPPSLTIGFERQYVGVAKAGGG